MAKPRVNALPLVFSLLLAFPLLFVAIVLAIGMLAGGSAGGTLASGRKVMAHSDSISLSSTLSSDSALIETAGRKILVQPTSLIVDGVVVARIDKDVADIQVRVNRGVVTFVADGTPVSTTLQQRR